MWKNRMAFALLYAALLVLLLVSCAVNWRTFLDGFRGLGKTPSPDSLSILPALGAAVQCLTVLATGGYTDGTLMLAGPAALMLCMNAAGHALNAATVCDAFESVSGQDGYAVAYRLKDAGALRAISQGLSEPHPCVLVTRPTQIFRSFLTNSAAHGTSDKNQQQFVWLLGGCGLAAFLFTLITSKSAATAATAMTSLFCLAAPLAGTPPIGPASTVRVSWSPIPSSLATLETPSGIPMPRLTTALGTSSIAARRAITLRALSSIGGIWDKGIRISPV